MKPRYSFVFFLLSLLIQQLNWEKRVLAEHHYDMITAFPKSHSGLLYCEKNKHCFKCGKSEWRGETFCDYDNAIAVLFYTKSNYLNLQFAASWIICKKLRSPVKMKPDVLISSCNVAVEAPPIFNILIENWNRISRSQQEVFIIKLPQ